MHFEPNPEVFDAFLAARQGKFSAGATSFFFGLVFFVARRLTSSENSESVLKAERIIRKYESVVKPDALSRRRRIDDGNNLPDLERSSGSLNYGSRRLLVL